MLCVMLSQINLFGNTSNTPEICDNRIDDDGDGLIDCFDPDCGSSVACWQCETEFYQVHSNSTLVSLDPVFGTYNFVANISGAQQINGAQFNHIDGHVYAPCVIDGTQVLGILSQDGFVTSTGLELPGSGIFYAGGVSPDGVMYISNGTGIHSIDLNQEILSVVNTGVPHAGVADFSVDNTNGLFYGITGSSQLKVFDPYSLELSAYSLSGSINSESGGFGAAWSCIDGSFYAYNNNSGKIYTIDVTNLTATEVLNATGNLSINDGFNCLLAPPPFESNCSDGLDGDNDGLADCDDPDCFSSNVCTIEICDNGIDDDGDGWIDCSDSECFYLELCFEDCTNGIDDNGNGLIDGDDPQCGTSGGVTGGLESNRSLSEKIALRNFYTRVKSSKEFQEKLEGLLPFENNEQRTIFTVKDFIPTEVLDAYVAESAPLDLIDITNAVDVAAADYYVDNNRVATILGIKTEEGVYEHTKYICDRLDGSRLLDISYLYAKGGNFISYELINKSGQKEFAVSFSAHHDEQNGFTIENHWNLHLYPNDKAYFNYQIWANSFSELIILLESLIEKMSAADKISAINHSAIPRIFVMQGNYENGALRLHLKNKNNTKEIDFNGSIARSEGGDLEMFNQSVSLSGSQQEIITIETGHLYDLGASLSSSESPDDEIFLADGAWGIDDQNPNAIVNEFIVSPEEHFYEEEVFQVERSVSAKGNVRDYLNIFRSLDAKLNPMNLNNYNGVAFTASGVGNLEISIVKSSIDEWEDQFRTVVSLNLEPTDYVLSLDDFVSKNFSGLEISDVTSIVFTLLGDKVNFVNKELKLSKLRFQNFITSSVAEQDDEAFSIYPNPVSKVLNFKLDNKSETILCIYNDIGKLIFDKTVQAGTKEISVDVSSFPEGIYMYKFAGHKSAGKGKKFIKLSN